jgi:hypothetical protein
VEAWIKLWRSKICKTKMLCWKISWRI